MLIRNLPAGTKAALRARAAHHRRSAEAEARAILAEALEKSSASMADLLAADDGADIDFEPGRLGTIARTPDL
jgi:plasmid stability protein